MRFLFRTVEKKYRIKLYNQNFFRFFALDTWMCLKRGEGELGVENQGRSRAICLQQETGAIGQHAPWIGDGPKAKSQVQDARRALTQLPILFSAFAKASADFAGVLRKGSTKFTDGLWKGRTKSAEALAEAGWRFL